jgi:phosphonopyruvate decarboxylase
LADKKVYQIPVLLIIGWRGEPGVKDEPQHVSQGELTLPLLKTLRVPYEVLDSDEKNAEAQISDIIEKIQKSKAPAALVIRKGTFEKYALKNQVESVFSMNRENALKQIISQLSGEEVIVSTTGKTSRELFEIRASLNQSHGSDFLTVGGMGHASQIALGIALEKPDRKIICIDGDGAVLMHMGSMAIIGNMVPENYLHVIINNGAHESVGGQPTVCLDMDIPKTAIACGYKNVCSVEKETDLKNALVNYLNKPGPSLIEIKVNVGSRENLGRPTIQPVDNKKAFMQNLDS